MRRRMGRNGQTHFSLLQFPSPEIIPLEVEFDGHIVGANRSRVAPQKPLQIERRRLVELNTPVDARHAVKERPTPLAIEYESGKRSVIVFFQILRAKQLQICFQTISL